MRTFKHEKTKWIAETHTCIPRSYRVKAKHNLIYMPAELIEDSSDWIEQKDYEILKVKTKLLNVDDRSCAILRAGEEIISVKRLSDEFIVSMGDYVEGRVYEVAPKYGFSGIVTAIDEVDGDIFIRWTGKNSGVASLKFFAKSRKPILTSEDGVDLFEGDEAFIVNIDDLFEDVLEAVIRKIDPSMNFIYFSTRQAAEEYRLWNYRGLSMDDIFAVFDGILPVIEEEIAELKELIKSRLK